jgi:hypothetical protein
MLVLSLTSACVHVQKSTDLSYLLHTDYAAFEVNEDPMISVSNFIGYCLLPMDKPEDSRGALLQDLAAKYLSSNGFRRVQWAELRANKRLAPKTFLVGLSYVESFAYETLQLQMNLYFVNTNTHVQTAFWSWKAKYDAYPLNREKVEPAFRDLFLRKPMEIGEDLTLFPRMDALPQDMNAFYLELATARERVSANPERFNRPLAPADEPRQTTE